MRFSHACAECAFRHIVSRCGPQAVKQTIIWVQMTGLKLWNRPLLGSDDGPQAVKQTITWVLMTGLKLWNRPLLLPWVPMTGLALVRPVYLTAWAIRMQNESGDLYLCIGQIKSEYKQRWHERNSVYNQEDFSTFEIKNFSTVSYLISILQKSRTLQQS